MNLARSTRGFIAASTAIVIIVSGLALAAPAAASTSAAAAQDMRAAPPASEFDPGYIISDALFFNGTAMNEADVQYFLNSQVSSCVSGYTCLKDYRGNTGNQPVTPMCNGYAGANDESAARIIVKVAQSCGISPKVLLVLMQKEQSLVTSRAPSQYQYSAATGFGCPDDSPCDSSKAGLFNQLFNAAYYFKRYTGPAGTGPGTDYTTNWPARYPVGQTSAILYNPDSSCGTKNVYIRNQATHALYIYTPYTPNQAAMNNLYGLGDSCSAYGNRNFWRIYYDWFGNPSGGDTAFVKALFADLLGRTPQPADVAVWNSALIAGRSKSSIATQFLYTREYLTIRIQASYQTFLGRAAEPSGLEYWISITGAGGVASIDDVDQFFLRSDEYYVNLGSRPDQFVENVFQYVLKRSASENDKLYWSQITEEYGRGAVVRFVYASTESSYLRANAMYQKLLGRDIEENGKLYWGPLISSLGDNVIRAAIVNAPEYSLRARTRFPGDD
ncbi:hypothetical protein QMG83_14950 [Salinibacterium sp. G-O1]|uniref:DUF4214 domain-containing protein n=1 Tax=Salinibacterium sp. G-O1 TaxID=3046208 RepID=UPI0024BA5464|nr:hypothetical protein [Salinibacterium sp. G-O1]MDJ0336524.1 hypothetical protein [Salinibacterium sp. G-O1]